MEIYKIRQIDLDNIVYSKPKGKGDRKVILIGYRDYEKNKIVPLIFQTAELYCGDSVEKIKNGNGPITHQLDVPIHAISEKKTNEFKEFLMDLNEKVIEDAKLNRHKWFGDIDELKYKSLIRKSTNNSKMFKNGTIKLKLANNKQFKTHVFDENKNSVDPEKYLVGGSCYIKIMIEISALWISGGNYFGIATRVYQIAISRSLNSVMSTETYAFVDESDDENYEELVEDTEMEDSVTQAIHTEKTISISESEENIDSDETISSDKEFIKSLKYTYNNNKEDIINLKINNITEDTESKLIFSSDNSSDEEIMNKDPIEIQKIDKKKNIQNMDPAKLERLKQAMTELNMTEDGYPNIVTESQSNYQ